jgi:hypothetical protein
MLENITICNYANRWDIVTLGNENIGASFWRGNINAKGLMALFHFDIFL